MTDDLVKRLANAGNGGSIVPNPKLCRDAKARIEVDAATIADLRAENERMRKRGERMHRRAQKAEGKIARTTVFLNSLRSISKSRVKELGASFMRYFDAAIHHARSGSNIGFHLGYFQHKATTERLEAVSAQLTAMTANADALAKATKPFARWVGATYPKLPDDHNKDICVTAGEIRQADAALAHHNQLRKEG